MFTKWMTLEQAAEHVTHHLEFEVTAGDLLTWSAQGDLPLYISTLSLNLAPSFPLPANYSKRHLEPITPVPPLESNAILLQVIADTLMTGHSAAQQWPASDYLLLSGTLTTNPSSDEGSTFYLVAIDEENYLDTGHGYRCQPECVAKLLRSMRYELRDLNAAAASFESHADAAVKAPNHVLTNSAGETAALDEEKPQRTLSESDQKHCLQFIHMLLDFVPNSGKYKHSDGKIKASAVSEIYRKAYVDDEDKKHSSIERIISLAMKEGKANVWQGPSIVDTC